MLKEKHFQKYQERKQASKLLSRKKNYHLPQYRANDLANDVDNNNAGHNYTHLMIRILSLLFILIAFICWLTWYYIFRLPIRIVCGACRQCWLLSKPMFMEKVGVVKGILKNISQQLKLKQIGVHIQQSISMLKQKLFSRRNDNPVQQRRVRTLVEFEPRRILPVHVKGDPSKQRGINLQRRR